MKFFSSMFLALMVALISLPANAAGFSFTRPTQRQDGTALNAADITGYEFDCGAVGTTTGVTCATVALGGAALSGTIVISFPASGGTACVRGRTSDVNGFGPWSATSGCKTVAPPAAPGAPGNIIVAYVINITEAQLVSAVKAAGGTIYLAGNYPPQP